MPMAYSRPSAAAAHVSWFGALAYTRPGAASASASFSPGGVKLRILAAGPLSRPAVLARQLFLTGNALAASPLRGAAVLLKHVVVARPHAASPLGRASALVVHDFTGALGDATTRYVMDLVTPGGTVRVPVSSWQATLQTGSSNYVQCVVPACAPWVEAINAATEFVIYRVSDVPGTALAVVYEMARSAAEFAQFDRGPQRYTCTLSGYPDAFAEVLDPPATYDRTLTGVRSTSSGSALRVRCAVDWLLRPGQRAYLDALPFVVRYINYYAMQNDSYMDVGE